MVKSGKGGEREREGGRRDEMGTSVYENRIGYWEISSSVTFFCSGSLIMMAASLEGPRGLMIEGANTSDKFLLSMRLLFFCVWTLGQGGGGGGRIIKPQSVGWLVRCTCVGVS